MFTNYYTAFQTNYMFFNKLILWWISDLTCHYRHRLISLCVCDMCRVGGNVLRNILLLK